MEIDKKDRLKRWKLFIETGVLTHLCKFYDLGDMCGSNGGVYKKLCPQKYIPGDIIQCGFKLIPGVVLRGENMLKAPERIAKGVKMYNSNEVVLTEMGWQYYSKQVKTCQDCDAQCDSVGKIIVKSYCPKYIHFADKQPLPELPTCPGCGGKSEILSYTNRDGILCKYLNCCECNITTDLIPDFKKVFVSWIGNRVAEYNINDYKQYWEVKNERN